MRFTPWGLSLCKIVAQAMGEAVAIFDGSGTNREIGVKQTAIRFVWSGITVDKARAQKILGQTTC